MGETNGSPGVQQNNKGSCFFEQQSAQVVCALEYGVF